METADAVAVIILLIALAGAAAVWSAGRSRSQPNAVSEHGEPEDLVQSASSNAPVVHLVSETNTAEKPLPKKRKPRVIPEITVDTPLGRVSFKKPRKPVGAVIVALGQSEDHLRWFYDVHRREYLERAAANCRAYQRGKKDASNWSKDYFDWMQDVPQMLKDLDNELKSALQENRAKIDRGEVTFLGAYDTVGQAREAARYLSKKREATEHAGWLKVHVVEIPPSTQAKAAST